MSTTFYLGKTTKDGKAPIFVQVQSRKLNVHVIQTTNLYIAPNIWEHRTSKTIMDKYRDNDSVQRVLLLLDVIWKKIEGNLKSGVALDKVSVHDIIHNCVFSEEIEAREREEEEKRRQEELAKKMTLAKFMKQYYDDAQAGIRLTEKGTVYAAGTLQSIRQAIDHFHAFQKRKKKVYDFDDIDMDFYRDYISFLNKENYALNTVGKNINWLKTILALAEVEGYHHNGLFRDKKFKGARVEVDSIYLTKEDLDKLRKVQLPPDKPHYELARDIFLVGVWTAQRISDYNNISRDNIQRIVKRSVIDIPDADNPSRLIPTIVENETLVIILFQKKTGAKVAIPCSTELKNILEKYDYDIPHMADQKVNEYMKDVAELAGLNEPVRISYIKGGRKEFKTVKKYELVHTHTARRTGATLMYLSGMDLFDIMKITGHSTPQTLKRYIKADELEVVDKIVDKYDYFD